MAGFEIEIKSLLGNEENAEKLRQGILSLPEQGKLIAKSSQLNHYFIGGDREKFIDAFRSRFSDEQFLSFQKVVREGKTLSVRTRQANGKVLLVVKASIDDTTSANGISRMEFEEAVSLSLEELDTLLVNCGFSYQSKWSREREEFSVGDVTVCLDRNAGYGYVAEFEVLVDEAQHAEDAKQKLFNLMSRLGVEELLQDRLERMFAYYNEHWPEYYGTDRVFTVE